MTKKKPLTKQHLIKRRIETVWMYVWEGYTDIEIAGFMGLERTWVYRLRKRMPKDWKPTLEKVHLPEKA